MNADTDFHTSTTEEKKKSIRDGMMMMYVMDGRRLTRRVCVAALLVQMRGEDLCDPSHTLDQDLKFLLRTVPNQTEWEKKEDRRTKEEEEEEKDKNASGKEAQDSMKRWKKRTRMRMGGMG